jgi:hypothetical protein
MALQRLFMVVGLSLICSHIVSSGTTNRDERGIQDDIEDWGNDMKDTLWGGRCIQDSQCSVVSHCDGAIPFGECKLNWWFILIVAMMALLIISAIVSCLCCPCCLLYSCGKAICDCLCCCCPSSRGRYSRP